MVLRSYWSIKYFYLWKSRPSYYFEDRCKSFVDLCRLLKIVASHCRSFLVLVCTERMTVLVQGILMLLLTCKMKSVWYYNHSHLTERCISFATYSTIRWRKKNKKCKVISNICFMYFKFSLIIFDSVLKF